ncbi:MAG: acyltransferase [Chitinophagaceae bacterium]|nr:acyltransferase [Chitinophagaceae bacterium]
MLFNSIEFAIFLPIVFILYWFVANKSITAQNILLIIVSYIFYAWWDWRFLFLLFFSTFLDYFTGSKMYQTSTTQKKIWFTLSIVINLGLLGFFKYYNFFIDSFADLLTLIGVQPNVTTLNIILPIGISFYTFHGMSYVIDIYNDKIKPVDNFIEYAVFVSFFPLLVAGPIERAGTLLPQFSKKRSFDFYKSVDGMRQILWGLFKKIVIADNCAIYANDIFQHYSDYSGSTLLLGAVLFTFQIYGDFSGYSDIAIGTARLFGFDLMRNFAFPYFSRDIAEFWRRWHISLSSWLRDYVYIPLGGSKGGTWMKVRNTVIIFLISGFWHGASWTFIAWGALNALYILPLVVFNLNRKNTDVVAEGKKLPSVKELFQIVFTFSLTVIAWIFFRSKSITDAFDYIHKMFGKTFIHVYPSELKKVGLNFIYILGFIVAMMVVEWIQREKRHGLQFNEHSSRTVRWSVYYAIILLLLVFSSSKQEFIYFQF